MRLFPPASVDTFIAGRLPAWLTSARLDRLHALKIAMREQEAATHRLRQAMQHIPPLDQFALPLLCAALEHRGVSQIDAKKCWVLTQHEIVLPAVSLSMEPLHAVVRGKQVLLAAALHNYHIGETRPSPWRSGLLVDEHGKRLPIGFTAFAGMCRGLDIGQRYQTLLEEQLKPGDAPGEVPGTAALGVRRLFENTVRAHFNVDVRMAALQGVLDEDVYLCLLPFMSKRAVVPALEGTVVARQLYLLGKQIRGLATFEINTVSATTVLAWIPGDPHGALLCVPSWQALQDELARRLTDLAYLTFFLRFLSQRDGTGFHQLLLQRIAERSTPAQAELDARHLPVETGWSEHLAGLHIDKLFDDARVLAVPTGDEDEEDRQERLRLYAALGMELSNLAALFLPVVGEVLLMATAWSIGHEIFEGYEDWQLGDRQGALDHVIGVAGAVVQGVLLAPGFIALDRYAFVDQLVPVRLPSGEARLAMQDLAAYQVRDTTETSESKKGGAETWLLSIEDAQYRVVDDAASGIGRITHPVRNTAYAPEVYHNRAGGWFHEQEYRQHWQGSGLLLRRMSGRLIEMTDATAGQLLRITGYDQAQIRRLHLEGVGLPDRIADIWELYQLHEQDLGLQGELFDAELTRREPPLTALEQPLRRDFPGLSLQGIKGILIDVDEDQVDSLLQRQRVPLNLAQCARWYLRDQRLDRACAGLQWPRMTNADTERLALGLLDKLEPWPASVRIELREHSPNGRLVAQSGSGEASEVRTLIKHERHYRLGVSNEPMGLLEALKLSLGEEQKLALGQGRELSVEALRERLLDAAASDREAAGRLVGLASADLRFRPPRRFADGRSGYPLSGRGAGSQRAVRCGIHRIFPTLTDQQVDAFLEGIMQRNVGLWEYYIELDASFSRLRMALHTWCGEADGVLATWRRHRVAQQLRRSWRRKITNDGGEYVVDIRGLRVGRLPDLPEGLEYGHIRRMRLTNMALTELPEGFLARFPNLLTLDLRSNALVVIPPGIEQLTQLRQLLLSNNRLTIDAAAQTRLDALQRLQRLDLAHNPLGQSPSLSRMQRLRRVSLRDTQLTEFPTQVPAHAYLDLRENRISQIHEDLRLLRDRLERTILHDNPLDEPSLRLVNAVAAGESRSRQPYRHRTVDNALLADWLGPQQGVQRERYTTTWEALRAESGSSDLFRFLADFAHGQDFEQHPGHYRRRVWSLLEFCEQHEPIRERVFQAAGGRHTCDDRLLYILGELELAVQVERTLGSASSTQLEPEIWRLGRAYFRLDEVDRIAARHIERMHAEGAHLVDDIEVRFYYRSQLAHSLGLPVEEDSMHYAMFANVTSRDLINAQGLVLAAENSQVLIDALAQRPFWQSHVRAQYSERFDDVVERFQPLQEQNLADLEAGDINEWQYSEKALSLRYEYEAAEREFYRTLAAELQQRLNV